MKKLLTGLLMLTLVFILAACGSNTQEADNTASNETVSSAASEAIPDETTQAADKEATAAAGSNAGEETVLEPDAEAETTEPSGNILIAYFSRTGNTETIANMIAEQTGGELFKVETVTPYPDDYDETVNIAREEQDTNARPELSTHVEDMSQYDVIYLGYPNWWGTMPMAMFTFLEEYDFSGKTMIPFCTHGGSALRSSEEDIASLAPDATLLEGLAVPGSSVDSAQDTVAEWLAGLSLTE